MKKLNLLGALLGALVVTALLAPAAAAAAADAPIAGTDDVRDVIDRQNKKYAKPTIDITRYAAERRTDRIRIVVGYADLKQTPYTRRLAGIVDGATTSGQAKGQLVELRTGANGATAVSVVVTKAVSGESRLSVKSVSCPAAKATPDYAADQIVFVLPTSCYRLGDPDAVTFVADAFQYTPARWDGGPMRNDYRQPDYSDERIATWSWRGRAVSGPGTGSPDDLRETLPSLGPAG